MTGMVGSFFTASSFIMMKISHNMYSRGHSENKYFNCYWITGFVFILCGCLANTISLGIGNQMLLAGTSPVTVILTCVLSVIILKERLLKIDIVGIAVICLGSALFVMQAKNNPRVFTQQDVYELYTRTVSVCFLFFAAVLIVSALTYNNRIKQSLMEHFKVI